MRKSTFVKLWRVIVCLCILIGISPSVQVFGVEIHIEASTGHKPISPALYGKNNELSDDPRHPLSLQDWQFLQEAGVRLLRECGGNNATKYNWQRKLSSHPDWYNNVYDHDWDYAATSLQAFLPDVQGMWAFQLIGKAAATGAFNFNDWEYNGSQWWEGVRNNWAGNGDPNLYLMDWTPEDTVGILDHWLDPNELGLDPNGIQYWNMDNEPEIWNGTHDDVMPVLPAAETFMQTYFEVAKLARNRFPNIKLAGPVTANEWQWYNWDNQKIPYHGTSYTWLEYFIIRIAEEQQASGVRLLDVLDLHFYPYESDPADIVQLHRVWFDTAYDYPGANGVKRAGAGAWNNNITQEYVFTRCGQWLERYLGPNHDVTFGVSEMGVQGDNPNVTAVWYASTLGVFADEGVELFTPWHWKTGMWEVLHLFSRYHHTVRIPATSDQDETVSAYAAVNPDMNDMSIMLVNRSLNQDMEVAVTLSHFDVTDDTYSMFRLNDLPRRETFVSHTDNALTESAVSVSDNQFTLSLPPLSITAVLLSGQLTEDPEDSLPDNTNGR